MDCKDIHSCFDEINAYCSSAPTGKALLVNTENYNDYQQIRAKLETDSSKICLYASAYCPENGVPDLDDVMLRLKDFGCQVLIGCSQTAMLKDVEFVEDTISKLLALPIHDHAIVLLDHCEQSLKKFFSYHPDRKRQVVLVDGSVSPLPRIRFAKNAEECIGYEPQPTMKRLFQYLEKLSEDKLQKHPEVTVVTRFSTKLFERSLYPVAMVESIYAGMKRRYSDVASATEESFGTEAQWRFLAEKVGEYRSLSAVTESMFGSTANLAHQIGEVLEESHTKKFWYLWLSMKVFDTKRNRYLTFVLQNSVSVSDFEEHIYIDLLKKHPGDWDFKQCYFERKRLLDGLPENISLLDEYVEQAEIYGKDAAYYLTDGSEKEELKFMQCMSTYEYTEDELLKMTEHTFPEVHRYLQVFCFDSTNTKVPSSAETLWGEFTEYFRQYKLQKLTNRITQEHLAKVKHYAEAETRPYNMVQPRMSIVSKIEKAGTQVYFFDALGVEYLAYIKELCQRYALIAKIEVAHCELPSITTNNKDFLHTFPCEVWDIKDLDELKHHSQMIDYEKCKEPIHIFRELEIINEELRKIQSCLQQDKYKRAVLVSDHGASRLAVIHEQENPLLELEESGEHSGRCCPVQTDPKIPYASFCDGYSVLANYDRFKGGRKANVEVHGGATLEEVLVPVIVLTQKPADSIICFTDSQIKIKGREPATIVVYSNIPLQNPKLMVDGKFYDGVFEGDDKHAKFSMPELRRTGTYTADFYDGDAERAVGLEFHIKKGNTEEKDLFGKKKLKR